MTILQLKTFKTQITTTIRTLIYLRLYLRHVWKSHIAIMVRFSIKPDDQTDETESPNLVNKTGLGRK